MKNLKLWTPLAGALWLLGCQATLPTPQTPAAACSGDAKFSSSLFLIGDTGDPQLPLEPPETPVASEPLIDPVLSALHADVAEVIDAIGAERTAVIFLGDNVYPKGLAPPGNPTRAHGQRVLDAQITAIGRARGYFIPGNHDWERWGPDGWFFLKTQEEYLETHAPDIVMEPSGGCPGPVAVDFGEHFRLVFIDPSALSVDGTELWAEQARCKHSSADQTLDALRSEFSTPNERSIILLSHYPVITGGPHGGHYTWREHLFPLVEFYDYMWIPLPVIGSIYPLSRIWGVTDTDMMAQAYVEYVDLLLETTQPEAPLLIAAGHDHSLQVHRDATGRFHVVSGAGSASKVDRVGKLDTSLMSVAAPGYMRLDSNTDGTLRLSVTAIDGKNTPHAVFETCITPDS
jgi:hypothetical protein